MVKAIFNNSRVVSAGLNFGVHQKRRYKIFLRADVLHSLNAIKRSLKGEAATSIQKMCAHGLSEAPRRNSRCTCDAALPWPTC